MATDPFSSLPTLQRAGRKLCNVACICAAGKLYSTDGLRSQEDTAGDAVWMLPELEASLGPGSIFPASHKEVDGGRG